MPAQEPPWWSEADEDEEDTPQTDTPQEPYDE